MYTEAAEARAAGRHLGNELVDHVPEPAMSRGGRPDLAGARLRDIRCPTLLIVGGADQTVLGLNRTALDALQCRKALEIVPAATHLFEEPGAIDAVVGLAARWFRACFAAGGAPA